MCLAGKEGLAGELVDAEILRGSVTFPGQGTKDEKFYSLVQWLVGYLVYNNPKNRFLSQNQLCIHRTLAKIK